MNKEVLKKIVPIKLQLYYKIAITLKEYLYDIKRYSRISLNVKYAEQRLKRGLTLNYHIIEKGLTMPETRLGFGQSVVLNLIDMIVLFDKKHYSKDCLEFIQAVSVIDEYFDFHKKLSYVFDDKISATLIDFRSKFKVNSGDNQNEVTAKEYFSKLDKPFDEFAISRHSVRNFVSQNIPLPELQACISLAQSSPSHCNTQPSRVHVVKSNKQISEILKIQGGNRGFGQLTDTLLVITSDLSALQGPNERYLSHLNAGLFSMNLLNALHLRKIGACSLHWSVTKEKDILLRKILNIPDNEIVIMLITCGYVPDKFKYAASPRLQTNDITYVHL